MFVTQIDGSHTPVVRGMKYTEYQGGTKRKTNNSLYLSDRQGLPLAMSEPRIGNHADLYEIKDGIDEIASQLNLCGLKNDGLFNDADAGFDAKSFRSALGEHGIIANVCPNPRNAGLKEDYLFD